MSLYSDYAGGTSSGAYGSYTAPKPVTPAPTTTTNNGVNFGTIAHSFLNGLGHAAMHPVSTAVGFGKGLVNNAVNDAKAVGSVANPVNLIKSGVGAVKEATDLATGNHQAYAQEMAKQNAQFKSTYIGKMTASNKPGDLSGLGNAASFALDATTLGAGGSLVKQGVKEAVKGTADSLLKTTGKAVVKGAAENAAIGAGYGGAQSLQENNVSAKNLAANAGSGAATGLVAGGLLGGITHGTAALVSKAFHNWANLAVETAHPNALAEGQKLLQAGEKQKALPSGERAALPAQSVTAPIKTTAGPNGGTFGEFNNVSEETANKLIALNQTISNFHSTGTKASDVKDLGTIAATRNNAAQVVDGIAKDRAKQMAATPRLDLAAKVGRPSAPAPTPEALLAKAHNDLATGKDPQSLHYQAATEIAKAANQAYTEKVATVKHSDVYAPKISSNKVAVAKSDLADTQARAGQEQLGHYQLGEVQPHKSITDHAPVGTLFKQLAAAEQGGARISQLQALNQLIEHPEIPPEAKQHLIAQRDSLAPSAMPKVNESSPAANVRPNETPAPSTSTRQPVYANDLPGATAQAKAKPPTIREKLVTDAKKKVAASGEVVKPVGKESDVAAPAGTRAEKLYDKMTGGKGSGLINPSRAASRAGNVGFARTATDLVSNKRQVTYMAKQTVKEFNNLAKGVSHDDINAVLEGASTKDPKVQAAANFFAAHRDAIGALSKDAGTIKGQKENYLPHVANGLESRKGGGARGLSKNTRFNIERQSIEHTDSAGNVVKEDKYKTLNDFEVAVKKIDPKASAERDTGKLLEHLLITEGHAVKNADAIEKLMDTRMIDGRPALARTTEANLNSQKYKDYAVIDNKLVHPDAKNLYEAITKTGKVNNPFASALSKTNIFSKRLVTINGLVHAVKIWQSSFAAQGITRSLWAIGSRGATKDDFIRALGYGAKFARASNDNLFDEVGKATGLLGKMEKVTDPLTKALFHNFGDRQGMSTYKFIEGKLLKKGLSADEAGRIAADGANQVMHFVPEDQQSIVVRQASQLALFAGQFLQNTMKTATNAAGVGLDRTLSTEGQHAAQKLAISRISRMFAYSFAAAQAINLANTGKYTWQNGNGDPLNPIWFQTKGKGGYTKSYRITNMYGQLKDVFGLLTDPAGELQNKLAPGAKELVSQVANTDLFTGNKIAPSSQNEGQQLIDRMVHAASNIFTPAGVNLASPSTQPGVVQAARYAGINSSSTNANDHTDYTKLANDKAAAQKLEAAYQKGDQSKLAGMQALRVSGNDYFDKFFAANPNLDPLNKQFQGYQTNNSKVISTGIAAGFTAAKANGTTLAYMQSIQQSGSTYFSKFFTANPNLDPTSSSFDGTGTKAKTSANKARSASNKYSAETAKAAVTKYSKAKSTKGKSSFIKVKSSKSAAKSLLSASKPTKMKAIHVPSAKAPRIVGKGLTRRAKQVKF